MMETKPFKIDKNGTQYFADYTCTRCGGQGGANAWLYTGWTCYKCGGTGKMDKPHIIKVYTPEYEEKLRQRREKAFAKKQEKWRAEAPEKNREFLVRNGFNENDTTYVVLGNTFEIKDELKSLGCKFNYVLGWHCDKQIDYPVAEIKADDIYEKNMYGVYVGFKEDAGNFVKQIKDEYDRKNDTSEYVGKVGEKIEATVILKETHWYECNPAPWVTNTKRIYIMEDENGNCIVWNTTSFLEKVIDNECIPINKDDTFKIRAKVKEHCVYRNKKQTKVERLKVVE